MCALVTVAMAKYRAHEERKIYGILTILFYFLPHVCASKKRRKKKYFRVEKITQKPKAEIHFRKGM